MLFYARAHEKLTIQIIQTVTVNSKALILPAFISNYAIKFRVINAFQQQKKLHYIYISLLNVIGLKREKEKKS